jgi:hypothetical protein
MARVFRKSIRWRGIAAIVAVYGLVLQAFFAYSIATQAAAQDPTADGGAFFVICASHADGDALPTTDAPAHTNTHCPICTLAASGAALLPDPAAIPSRHDVLRRRTGFVAVAACISFHRARAGLSRAPPQSA